MRKGVIQLLLMKALRPGTVPGNGYDTFTRSMQVTASDLALQIGSMVNADLLLIIDQRLRENTEK